MTSYRIYECARNAGGGLDSTGSAHDHITADCAQTAADEAAASLAHIEECIGNIMVATDDDGDSAESIISSR